MTREEIEFVGQWDDGTIIGFAIADGEQLIDLVRRLSAKCKELEEESNQWDKHSLIEILIERNKLRVENQRLREALEKIACARDPFNGLALVMSDVAINALAQAAEKGGEWRKIK